MIKFQVAIEGIGVEVETDNIPEAIKLAYQRFEESAESNKLAERFLREHDRKLARGKAVIITVKENIAEESE